jgi:two-component system OmpR family response regulator
VNAVSKSILVVDDDQEIRELLQAYLSRSGFQVRTVGDGAQFRQAFNDEPSDLLILDVMLPDEDGFSLCRWVRQHPRQPHVPIIMLTASKVNNSMRPSSERGTGRRRFFSVDIGDQ